MAIVRLTVKEVAEANGIENPFALSTKTGLNYAICYKLWNGNQQRIDLKTLATLCEVFSLVPGDFFEVSQDEGETFSKNEQKRRK